MRLINKSFIEALVAFIFLSLFISIIFLQVLALSTTHEFSATLEIISTAAMLDLYAITANFVIILWLLKFDGKTSKLWRWLPPLVFLKIDNVNIRAAILMIASTIGLVLGMAGLVEKIMSISG